MIDIITNVELSPCIVAKARYALGLSRRPKNSKKCSENYWNRVINAILLQNTGVDNVTSDLARSRVDLYKNI